MNITYTNIDQIYVNGASVSPEGGTEAGIAGFDADPTRSTFVLRSDTDGGGVVDVVLNVPPQYFEALTWNATLVSLTTDGAFLPAPAPPARTLHALGDSITASTNIHGGTASCADEGMEADYSASWMGLLCLFFDASCSTIAVGGTCMLSECGGTQMQEYYKKERMVDAGDTFDFAASTPPDAFLIYLG